MIFKTDAATKFTAGKKDKATPVASGLASKLARDQSIFQVPDSFIWLGRGADLFGIPNAVILAGTLYVLAHLLMTRMTLGRYIYAVGGNPEAARRGGINVARLRISAFILCSTLAIVSGLFSASQTGTP